MSGTSSGDLKIWDISVTVKRVVTWREWKKRHQMLHEVSASILPVHSAAVLDIELLVGS